MYSTTGTGHTVLIEISSITSVERVDIATSIADTIGIITASIIASNTAIASSGGLLSRTDAKNLIDGQVGAILVNDAVQGIKRVETDTGLFNNNTANGTTDYSVVDGALEIIANDKSDVGAVLNGWISRSATENHGSGGQSGREHEAKGENSKGTHSEEMRQELEGLQNPQESFFKERVLRQ